MPHDAPQRYLHFSADAFHVTVIDARRFAIRALQK